MMRRAASMPSEMFLNPYERNSIDSGILSMRIDALVIIPSVPSEPTMACIIPGPDAWFGTFIVSMSFPGGTAASSCSTKSSAFPYLVDTTPEPRAAK